MQLIMIILKTMKIGNYNKAKKKKEKIKNKKKQTLVALKMSANLKIIILTVKIIIVRAFIKERMIIRTTEVVIKK